MTYDLLKDKTSKSAEIELNNETIITFFATEDSESGLPELIDGVYGAAGVGPMGPDWEPIGGGGGDSDFTKAAITINFRLPESVSETNNTELKWNISYISNNPGAMVSRLSENLTVVSGSDTYTTTQQIPLYKGRAIINDAFFPDMFDFYPEIGETVYYVDAENITISGNASIVADALLITGNATINIPLTDEEPK